MIFSLNYYCSPDGKTADCSGKGLTEVPHNVHKDILIMNFSNNNLREVPTHAFSRYSNINYLDLRNNSIDKINVDAFGGMEHIKIIDLSNNKLDHIPSKALRPLNKSLTELNLSSNNIYQINTGDFAHLPKLTLLDLSRNRIENIAKKSLSKLGNLEVLKVRSFQITECQHHQLNAHIT